MDVEFKEPYYDKALNRVFTSKGQKKEYMKANGIAHDGSMESQRKRTNRLCEVVNEERNKQGLKSKTEEELVGDSRPHSSKKYFFMK